MAENDGVELKDWRIDASRLWPGAGGWDGPLALVRLESVDVPGVCTLPPCPVIGIGDPEHPLAARLDCILESESAATAIVRNVLANPHAAAVTVGLLRMLPGIDAQAGLEAESLAYAVLQGSSEHAAWLAKGPYPAQGAARLEVDRQDDCLSICFDTSSGGAIDRKVRDDLHEALSLAVVDSTITRVVLSGRGRTFSLGADLGEFGTTRDPASAHLIRSQSLPARMAARCADRLEARIHGACGGAGLELAAWASRIVATPDAWFHLPELSMGILPGAGGCVALTRRIGRQRTAWLILSGKRISARTALKWGLVDEIAVDPHGADII